MTYEVYRYIFYGGAVLAAILLVVSVVLFFVLKIPAVIGDLSGATARKAIENIRNQNENSGEKKHGASVVNKARGRVTDKISPSGNLVRNPSANLGNAFATEKISTQKLVMEESVGETTVLEMAEETTVLSYAGETTLLENVFVIEYEITYVHTQEVIV